MTEPACSTQPPETVLTFWFDEIEPAAHWRKDPQFDALIRARFAAVHRAACRCELADWRATLRGRLAEIIVLDQFSRNLFRDDPRAFAAAPLALALAQEALRYPEHKHLPPLQRAFLYMPFMHSESLVVHDSALTLFAETGLENSLRHEHRHREVLLQFGRYPSRNAALGRISTRAELQHLAQPGARF